MNCVTTFETEADFYQDNLFQGKREIIITKKDGKMFVQNGNKTKKEATLMFNGWKLKFTTEEGVFLVFDNYRTPYPIREMFRQLM